MKNLRNLKKSIKIYIKISFHVIIKKIRILVVLYDWIISKIKFIKKLLIKLNLEVSESNKIVTAFLEGGLGNQLFQIANALAYAWEYSFIPLFKKIKKVPNDINKPRPSYWNTIFRKIHVVKRLPLKLSTYNEKFYSYKKIPSPNNIMNMKKNNGIILYGYFQSAKYFYEYREKLLNEIFFIKLNEKEALKKKYPEIFDNKISIELHIRKNDYLRI